ncbi:MAG: dockerin type I domain-containing protein [Candidatus Methanoperedenaceae archaeon]|nr:dockerin type I domain-containing protein [Candidatus Methanoperedenaceae archaeon]
MASNATQTRFDATTDYSQSYVIINNTVPGFANKNLSFTADGITYANSTADSKGFVSFNYTGTWSKHTFEWVMESDKIVNILDLLLVAQHFGEETSAPYPDYDANKDGKVDISDVVLVAREVF